MAKWTTPGIGFTEVDNTSITSTDNQEAVGAIVFQSNRGRPNQRIFSDSLSAFQREFGTAESVNDYGHIAASLYFGYGGSEALYGIRATMGDEKYAQIQYPLTNSPDVQNMDTIQYTNYIDSKGDDVLDLIQAVDSTSVTFDETVFSQLSEGDFSYAAKSYVDSFQDLYDMLNGIDTTYTYIFREPSTDDIEEGQAYYFSMGGSHTVYSKSGSDDSYAYNKNFTSRSDLVTLKSNYTSYSIGLDDGSSDVPYYNISSTDYFYIGSTKYSLTLLYIPSAYTLNSQATSLRIYTSITSGTSYTLEEIAALSYNAYLDSSTYYCTFAAYGLTITNWDDGYKNTYVVVQSTPTDTPFEDIAIYSPTLAYGMAVTPYGESETINYMVTAASGFSCVDAASDTDKKKILYAIAAQYNIDPMEISSSSYGIVTYTDAKSGEEESILVKILSSYDSPDSICKSCISDIEGIGYIYNYTWSMYMGYQDTSLTIASNYGVSSSVNLVKPWQIGKDLDSNGSKIINQLVAMSTTEALSLDKYSDGYTSNTYTDYDPGNGDIETYNSVKSNQMVIAAIGPGEFGNNIGISVITPEAAEYPALYSSTLFNWKYKYDDAELVDSDTGGNNYLENPNDLVWKKVYRINVYSKTSSQNEDTWGFGLTALQTEPLESWYVSNDPNAKDENGNSLYAPIVINGNSNYIYISRHSLASSYTQYKSSYAIPEMTLSIYQLTGGENSNSNYIKEKLRALDLYSDRKKCDFDYLFNVEGASGVDYKFKQLQIKIGNIAKSRGMCLGIIQATSMEAKTAKKKISEANDYKSLNGSSYVVAYDGYDLYYSSDIDSYVYIPRSVAGAVACANVDVSYHPWSAPAGVDRGLVEYSLGPLTKLSDSDFGKLYSNNINSTLEYPAYGTVLMGQKTLQKKDTALNRIDVRKLCNYIEKELEDLLLPYLFQKNTASTRSSIKSTVDTFLSVIEAGEGIISRTIEVVTDSSDPHLLYVKITFVPAESIERIEVVLTLNRSTSSVNTSEE